MGICTLVDELNRLRKSSGDSIDSDKSFETFKQYMHIERDVEDELKKILRNIRSTKRKTLVLLCGSAGDGKSHMLSYLKNYDSEHLLEGFRIHNDATESSSPTKTAIETLSDVLQDFTDERIEQPGECLILAINLGVLNNFIESEYGRDFSLLKKYVEDRSILSSKVVDREYNADSPIQHVSFADYQLYTLTENGANSTYIHSILGKIFNTDEKNPFFGAYCNGCKNCPLQTKCPVKFNFMFLQNQSVQDYVTKILIMTIIKKKEILTTREILNYFYDITVPQEFNYTDLGKALSNDSSILKKFLRGMTPYLMFGQEGVSTLMSHVSENDPVLLRNEEADDFAVEYYIARDVSEILRSMLCDTSYKDFLLNDESRKCINSDKEIKSSIFSCIVRLRAMQNNDLQDPAYDEFVTTLYHFNAGNSKKLNNLFKSVGQAFLQWCGTDEEKHVCLKQTNQKYSLFEETNFKADATCIPPHSDEEELHRFIPELKVGYKMDGTQIEPLEIDFPLYRMIMRLNKGYVHTVNDSNNHADFISFIERMLYAGNSNEKVYIVAQNGRRARLVETELGTYEFEVMR